MTRQHAGPHGGTVDRFLERMAAMEAAEVDAAVHAWRESQRAADPASGVGRGSWSAAEDAAAEALVRTGRSDEAWMLQERIHTVFRRAPWRRALLAGTAGAAGVRSEATAQYLAATATVALLLADALPPRHLATLYSPFHALIPLADLAPAPSPLAALHRNGAPCP